MKKRLVILTISIITYMHLLGQVTIGSLEAPSKGAIIQLKNIDAITNGGANSDKGLALLRVNLESETDLYPMFSDNKTYYLSNKSTLDLQHTGLVVFNLKDLRVTIDIPESECDPPLKYSQKEKSQLGWLFGMVLNGKILKR